MRDNMSSNKDAAATHKCSGGLLNSKRFLPLFVTQFFSALNDNVYKQAVLLLLVFQAASLADGALYSNLAAGLFILPFFLF
jgi:hypothetical protein